MQSEDMGWKLYEATFGDEGGYQAFDECIDWPKFEELVKEKRQEKIEALTEKDG
jgi:hypothetical protein